uniref:Uncharacterized protein n=1 Tax=Nothobranchius korthausae TaxID=1143690 RepID=A0A1A8F2R5_9TELE
MNVEYLALSRDGKQIPSKAFQPTFDQRTSVREFYNLFTATSRQLKDLPLSINRLEYQQGYTLYAFNLNTADDLDALSPVSTGNLRMEMRFGAPLRDTATLIVYACYDSILEINSKRELSILPKNIRLPAYVVVNTHPSHLPGEHWLALAVERDGFGTFFDSYGFTPELKYYPETILNFLKQRCSRIQFQDQQLQSLTSDRCGHHCVFFLCHKACGFSMKQILSKYHKNVEKNDAMVHNFVKKFSNCIKRHDLYVTQMNCTLEMFQECHGL